jgi:dTDP-4-dehydrorhamnose 3,5-epimerase
VNAPPLCLSQTKTVFDRARLNHSTPQKPFAVAQQFAKSIIIDVLATLLPFALPEDAPPCLSETGMKLDVSALPLSGACVIHTSRLQDERGYFAETYAQQDFFDAGICCTFVQDNQSCSKILGTIRGLHFQSPPYSQAKLVRVLHGAILDVIVDLRRSSPTYGKHAAVELSEDNQDQLFVPAGFAHGFCTLKPDTEVAYKVDAFYAAAHDHGLNWADPALQIRWPVKQNDAVLSDKDRKHPALASLPVYFD